MKKALLALAGLVLAGLLGWEVYDRATGGSGAFRRRPERGSVAIEIAPVRTETVRDIGIFTGSVVPRSYFVVAPKVAGRLEKLTVEIGDRVRRGQLIAVLDDGEYAEQIKQARAALAVAEANVDACRSSLVVAKREYERYAVLVKKEVSSESELDISRAKFEAERAKVEVAHAQVKQKQAELKTAEVRLSYTQIRAAWADGGDERIVGERFVDEGALLAPNTPVVSIIDISSVTAVVHVIEREYSLVRTGQEVVVGTDAFPGRDFTGKVVRLAPLLKETSRQARVEIEIPNAGLELKPGMFVRARIEFATHEKATVIPAPALARREGKQGVFVVDVAGKKARFVPVRLGITDGGRAEVLSPKLTGFVATLGHHLLEDGSAVSLPAGSAATADDGGETRQ